jgi:hypothetical protein
MPGSGMCRHTYAYGGDAACVRAKGCCIVQGGCESCVTVTSSGDVYVRAGTQQVRVCVSVVYVCCVHACVYVCMYNYIRTQIHN